MNYMTEIIDNRLMYRVTKAQARKLVKKDYTVYAMPVNMNPANIFCDWVVINNDILFDVNKDFDTYVHIYEIYNCNFECGRYCKFYIDMLEEKV